MLTVLLADATGPISFEAWRDGADQFLRNFSEWGDHTNGSSPLYVELQRFEARDDTRAHSGPLRRLHSTERTTLTRIAAPKRESLTNLAISPHPALYTKDFNRLNMKPPFTTNISGIVSSVSAETTSSGGEAMKTFRLQDAGGRYVNCRAFGRHSANLHIANGTDVILYFAQAQAGLNNQPGQLWIYDESHIVALQTECGTPVPRQLIELRG